MRITSLFRSRLLCSSISLLIVVVFATLSTDAAPKRRTAKSKKARIVKKTRKPVSEPVTSCSLATMPPPSMSEAVIAAAPPVEPVIHKTPPPLKPAEKAPAVNTPEPEAATKEVVYDTEEWERRLKESERALLAAPVRADANWLAEWRNAPQPHIERVWYTACYTDKDTLTCENFSKLLILNFPDSSYFVTASKFVIRYGQDRCWQDFQKALKDYYGAAPNVAKLNQLFLAGEPLMHMPYVLAQITLAGIGFAMADELRDVKTVDLVKGYLERAFRVFAPVETIGRQLSQAEWSTYRRSILSSGNQFLGYCALNKDRNPDLALIYLARAIAVKGDNNLGWKDPLNYYLRTNANNEFYARASKKYGDLSQEQRGGETGKALLAEIQNYMQRLMDDYARILVVTQTNRPEFQAYRDYAESSLRTLLRQKPNHEVAYQDLIKRIQAEFAA
ncbi:MAG: hypothetical protein HOP19_27365 [Acidobacteria bacterium]|nr:hypothetical protein [Acidobacteriota bacterium]